MPTPGGPRDDRPAAADGGDSKDTGRADRAPRVRRLETDEDVSRLIQEHYPLIDDPAARAAIVAQFARRHELYASQRHRRVLHVAIAVGFALLVIAIGWSVFGARPARLSRRAHG